MAQHVLDIATFRLLFPAFADPTKFPDAYIQAQWDMATTFIGDVDGCLFSGPEMQSALNLMTAHLMALNVLIAAGGGTGTIGVGTQATIDKVSVSYAPPPFKDGWQYWLSTTPYGVQLWALLKLKSAGGWYFGGRPERIAFRKVGGRFF